jgi:hypothetical protein
MAAEARLACDFPVARCALCARDVLTHVHLDERGEERRLCLHCDAELDPAELRWVTAEELAGVGYAVMAEEGAGCGRPGCGQGRCGNAPPV